MSKCELIELKDLSVSDPIELAAPTVHTVPPPVNPRPPSYFHVVRLVGDSVSIESPLDHSGDARSGHDFQPFGYTHPTWCDLCGEFIWGLYKQSLRCTYCNYTCHYRCRPFIQLDCHTEGNLSTDQTDSSVDVIETDTNVMTWGNTARDVFGSVDDSGSEWEMYFTAYTSFFHQDKRATDEQIEWSKRDLSAGEIQQKVKEYNAQINSDFYMVSNKDGSYTGFIKVHFELVRPISVPPCQRLSPEEDKPGKRMKRRTSFYLPKDTVKHLHISSQTRVRDVIVALLNKFTVVDNPAKFALFERTERQCQAYMRKLSDEERPLYLRLCAGPSEKVLSLVLKENETGEVNWDAFSFPELCNFLRILQREEEEHVRQIMKRYALARDMMKQAMARITTLG